MDLNTKWRSKEACSHGGEKTYGRISRRTCLLIYPIVCSLIALSGCVSLIFDRSTVQESRLKAPIPGFFNVPRSSALIGCHAFDVTERYKSYEFSFESWFTSDFKRNDIVRGRLHVPIDQQTRHAFIIFSGSGEEISSSFFAEIVATLGFTTVRVYAGFRPLPKKVIRLAMEKRTAKEALAFIGGFFRSAMRQRVVDIMRIADVLERTYGITRIHVIGTSQGGIVGNLFAAIDGRVESLMMVISAASIAHIVSMQEGQLQTVFAEKFGIRREELHAMIKKELEIVEPITYKERLPHKLLLVSGLFDMAGLIDSRIPFSATLETWRAYGRPEWIIIGTGHFTSVATFAPFWIELPYLHHLIYTAIQPYAAHILVEHFLPLALK